MRFKYGGVFLRKNAEHSFENAFLLRIRGHFSRMPQIGLMSVARFSWVPNLYNLHLLLENHMCQPDPVKSYRDRSTISYHIMPHHTYTSHHHIYHIIPYQTISCHTITSLAVSHQIIPHHTTPIQITPYHSISFRITSQYLSSSTISCHIKTNLAMSHHIIPRHTMSYHIKTNHFVSNRIMPYQYKYKSRHVTYYLTILYHIIPRQTISVQFTPYHTISIRYGMMWVICSDMVSPGMIWYHMS